MENLGMVWTAVSRRPEPRATKHAADVGRYLADARHRAGLDRREVAVYFGVPVRFVELIETGRFDGIPNPVHARGYVRCLAAALGLDQEGLSLTLDRALGTSGIVDPSLARLRDCVRPRSAVTAVSGVRAVEGGAGAGG